MGKNTRRLFAGYSKPETYAARYAKAFPNKDAVEVAQSNGFLMRASPLALIEDPTERGQAIDVDTALTNPSGLCRSFCQLYVAALRAALTVEGTEPAAAQAAVRKVVQSAKATTTTERDVLSAALGASWSRDVTGKQKGWCAHALSIALWSTLHARTFSESLNHIIKCGGDTDTNAAIAGALLGACFGRIGIEADPDMARNVQVVLGCKGVIETSSKGKAATRTPRPPEYSSQRYVDLVRGIANGCCPEERERKRARRS